MHREHVWKLQTVAVHDGTQRPWIVGPFLVTFKWKCVECPARRNETHVAEPPASEVIPVLDDEECAEPEWA